MSQPSDAFIYNLISPELLQTGIDTYRAATPDSIQIGIDLAKACNAINEGYEEGLRELGKDSRQQFDAIIIADDTPEPPETIPLPENPAPAVVAVYIISRYIVKAQFALWSTLEAAETKENEAIALERIKGLEVLRAFIIGALQEQFDIKGFENPINLPEYFSYMAHEFLGLYNKQAKDRYEKVHPNKPQIKRTDVDAKYTLPAVDEYKRWPLFEEIDWNEASAAIIEALENDDILVGTIILYARLHQMHMTQEMLRDAAVKLWDQYVPEEAPHSMSAGVIPNIEPHVRKTDKRDTQRFVKPQPLTMILRALNLPEELITKIVALKGKGPGFAKEGTPKKY